MNLARIESLILKRLGKNDQDFSIDGRTAIAQAETEANDLIRQYIDAVKPIPNGFYKPFVLDVVVDRDTDYKVAIPTIAPAVLGRHNEWILKVSPSKDMKTAFIILSQGQLSSIQDIETSNLGGRTGVWYEYGKFYLINPGPFLEKIRVLYVPQFSLLVDEDDVFGDSTLTKLIIDNTVRALMYDKEAKEDKASDNIDNTKRV